MSVTPNQRRPALDHRYATDFAGRRTSDVSAWHDHVGHGPDETLAQSPAEAGRHFFEETRRYWLRWVRNLAVPLEWQDVVIRAAITLKLNTFDDTGAIIAAVTTSIPEAPDSGRNWDYRFCWLRDAYFVVNVLNRLGVTGAMNRYLNFILNVVASAGDGPIQPVYSIGGEARIEERQAPGSSRLSQHGSGTDRECCVFSSAARRLR